MATLEQYTNRVIVSHPELVHQMIDQDIATAQGRLNAAHAEIASAQGEIDSLNGLKSQTQAPVTTEIPVVYDGQPLQS